MLNVTGGEPAKKIIPVSDADMRQVKALMDAGLGTQNADADAVFSALVKARRARGETAQAKYERFMDSVREVQQSNDPRAQKAWKDANRPLFRAAQLGSDTVHHDATLANLSVQYGNDEYIGPEFLPPVPVTKKSNTFKTYDKRSRLAVPDDDLGDMGDASELKDDRGEDSYVCKPRGNKHSVAATELANQDAPLDEMIDLTESIADIRALAREIRIASVVTTAGNYPTANKTTLAGAAQWNAAGNGNPIKDLQTADGALWRGRGPARTLAGSDLDTYQVLSRHPDILGLFQYNGSSPGLATPAMIARFLSWDDYLVGRARKDTAREGASASYARIWGKFFWVMRVANRASIRNASFGVTMRWTMPGVQGANGGILTQQWFDPRKGLGGVYYAKMGEAEDHKVVAADTGYLISAPIA